MRLLSAEKLKCLQQKPENIRNLCIMAHVDHGKTTLADSLLASNGIISQKMAGKLRYMDSRKDEQERGITMKSSSITLYYPTGGQEYLINLIDSPGHVDFSSEVSTAVRLCDGAIIVVDVVEGVCPQTQVALKQAWLENIKPVLVLNKIDRLILELKLAPLDAYICMSQVLEQVNAVMGRLFAGDVLEKNEQISSTSDKTGQDLIYDWSSGLEQSDDSNIYFHPNLGNVIFASALDGWAFSTSYFATLYSGKLGLDAKELEEFIWGDYYLNPKTKKICPGAQEKAKKPLFVQLVLDNIWTLYDTICVRKDKEKLVKIVESLGIKVTARDLRHNDTKVQLQAVCSQWLPVANSVLDMVCKKLPSANKLSEEKVEKLLCSSSRSFTSYPPQTQALKDVFLKCSSDSEAPVIVFVSKMFPMEKKLLPENRPKALTAEELNARREQARLRHAEKIASDSIQPLDEGSTLNSAEVTKLDPALNPPAPKPPDEASKPEEDQETDVFIAFARVYSGTVRPGQTLYVLGPKHDPAVALKMIEEGKDIEEGLTLKDLKGNQHVTKVVVSQLYLMMGRELDHVDEVPAGNVLGLGGLEDHILKTGTLSSVLYCPSFSQLQLMAVPILRVAVEPAKLSDLAALKKGLKLLNQADACVQVLIQETGEHVLITAGEVHLERCLDDLRNRYAKVEINASEPIVPFRETVIEPPKVDMVNEVIQEETVKKENEDSDVDADGIVTIVTPSKHSTIRILCVPLPPEVTSLLEKHSELIRTFMQKSKSDDNCVQDVIIEKLASLELNSSSESLRLSCSEDPFVDRTVRALANFRNELASILKNCTGIWKESSVNDIWAFGPRHYGPNILLNKIKGYEGRNVWSKNNKESALSAYDSSFINGFQMATLAGPLCEEPMMGVGFVVLDWTFDQDITFSNVYGPLSGQIMSAVKEGCRKSFQAQPQRLMAAMYSCNILANDEVLGKLYALLGKRQGRVIHEEMAQGSAFFNISAILPVIESFNFAQTIRKQTSGLASPQLVFSHWEVIDIDPFWCPSTEEEYLHYGEKADTENRARFYMESVRRRKGLSVQQKIVQFAEKQRTLSKKK